MYWPWTLPYPANQVPYQFAAGYVCLAVMFFVLSFTKASQKPTPVPGH